VNIRVSIITVCYNSEKTIERTIVSVLNQAYDNLEYIIVDGASTDRTLYIINNYRDRFDGRLKVISEPDFGIYDAMNKGIKACSGDLIGILNSDDYYFDQAIENVIKLAALNPDAGLFHGNMVFESQSGIPVIWRSKAVLNRNDFYRMRVNHPTAFVRKQIYDKFGCYDTKYRIVADYEFMVRCLIKFKIKHCYINELITYMHAGGASSNLSEHDYLSMREIIKEYRLSAYASLRWKLTYLGFKITSKCKRHKLVGKILPVYRIVRDTIKHHISVLYDKAVKQYS
jgi:glycosyltransferase involved in cell wall biosynthesis